MKKDIEQTQKGSIIFILDNASICKGVVGKKRKILSSGEDSDFLLRHEKSLNDYRPDIVHEALRSILDSPLNKLGKVGAVYVKTSNGVIFEVKPHVRLPRTLKRFCGIMLDLLEKKSVCSRDTQDVLLRIVDGPIVKHLPNNSRIIGLSYNSKKQVNIDDYISSTTEDSNLVFVVGTMVNGKINEEHFDDFISVSDYPLSAKYCVGMICDALETKWGLF